MVANGVDQPQVQATAEMASTAALRCLPNANITKGRQPDACGGPKRQNEQHQDLVQE